MRRCFDGPFDIACPHETSTLVVSHWMHVEQFFLQDIQVRVIQIEAYLQRSIGHPSLAFQKGYDLFQDVVKRHGRTPLG